MTLDPAVVDFIKALARANAARDIAEARQARRTPADEQRDFRKAS